jgi:hypothetical protein
VTWGGSPPLRFTMASASDVLRMGADSRECAQSRQFTPAVQRHTAEALKRRPAAATGARRQCRGGNGVAGRGERSSGMAAR